MTKPVAFEVAVPLEAWNRTGPDRDPSLRLHTTAVINKHYFHIEAYAVDPDSSEQRLADPWLDPEWEGLCRLEPDGAFETQEIEGREYIIVLRPHCV